MGPATAGRSGVAEGEAGSGDARYRTAEVARILGVSPDRVRRLVRRGHGAPLRIGRRYRFAFRDLVLLRTAQRLLRSEGIPARKVHRALHELQRQVGAGRPMSGVGIYAADGEVVVRDRDVIWHPADGQCVFPFAVAPGVRGGGDTIAPRRWGVDARRAAQSAVDWFDYGVAIEADDPDGARRAYESALQSDPDFADAYINLGRLVHDAGDARGAAKFYGEALRRNPHDAVTHFNAGVACEDLGRVAKARGHYERAVAIDPSFADAHFNLGRLLERSGDQAAALRHLLAHRRLSDRS